MKKFSVVVLFAAVALSSCDNTKKKATDFNNKLTAITDSLYKRGKAVGHIIQSATISHDYSGVAAAGTELDNFVAKKIEEVKAIENVGGSEKMKDAMLDFLNYESKISRDAFGSFAKLTPASTPEEVQAAMTNLIDKSKEESDYMGKLRKAQSDFAEKNGFKIMPSTQQ